MGYRCGLWIVYAAELTQQTLATPQIDQMVAAVDLIEALGRGWNRSHLPTASRLSPKPSAADYKQEQGETPCRSWVDLFC